MHPYLCDSDGVCWWVNMELLPIGGLFGECSRSQSGRRCAMKEAIYSWIKCLAIFYILLTMLLHLVPTEKYQRYVRFFMGLVLMVMLVTPVLSLFGKKPSAARQFFGTLPAGRAEAPGTGNGESPEKPAGNRNGGAAWRKYSGKFAKEWHRSPVLRSTYRRGAFKSLCMDQRGAG